jgi:hypothetical protein
MWGIINCMCATLLLYRLRLPGNLHVYLTDLSVNRIGLDHLREGLQLAALCVLWTEFRSAVLPTFTWKVPTSNSVLCTTRPKCDTLGIFSVPVQVHRVSKNCRKRKNINITLQKEGVSTSATSQCLLSHTSVRVYLGPPPRYLWFICFLC